MFYMKTWQQVALTVAFLFMVGSLLGWFIEVFYRRFFSKNNPERKWINPGFLTGPYVPLYGVGLSVVFAMSYIPIIAFRWDKEAFSFNKILLITIAMGIAMTLVEYIAGVIFVIGLKIKLWDYSNEWGNIKGIICPKFTLYWTVLSGVYYVFIQPKVVELVSWYYDNIAYTFIIGMFFGIFIVDFWYSMHVGSAISRFAYENGIVVKYEELKALIDKRKEELEDKARFSLSFVSSRPLIEHLISYKDTIKTVSGNVKSTAALAIKRDKSSKM